uniref:BTB domain-containing protein n=1 Tax=Parastrongyloides trichosuri TaxID=131310 RepID=A0A0N4Z2I7_PARTI
MAANIDDSICAIFKGDPLIDSGEDLNICPICSRDISKYQTMRKRCHVEACESSSQRHSVKTLNNITVRTPKKLKQTTLDNVVIAPSNSQSKIKKELGNFITKRSSTLPTNEIKTFGLLKNKSKCICKYTDEYTKARVAVLFTDKTETSESLKQRVEFDFRKEPFFSYSRWHHLELLARDIEKLPRRFEGDVKVIAKDGILKWHSQILQQRTTLDVKNDIDLSQFDKSTLRAYEKYIYGGEIVYSRAKLADLLILARKYGPTALKIYLEEDIVWDEDPYNERYETIRYNDALELEKVKNDNVEMVETVERKSHDSIESTFDFNMIKPQNDYVKMVESSKEISRDSFEETIDFNAFIENKNLNKNITFQTSHTRVEECCQFIVSDKKDGCDETLQMDDNEQDMINETINISDDKELNDVLNISENLENMVTNSQGNISCRNTSIMNDNLSYLDYGYDNFGVVEFEIDDVDDGEDKNSQEPVNKTVNVEEKVAPENKGISKNEDVLYKSDFDNQTFYSDESFCGGIIEGGFSGDESRSVTPFDDIKQPPIDIKKSDNLVIKDKSMTTEKIKNNFQDLFKTPKTLGNDRFERLSLNNYKNLDVMKTKRQIIEEQLTKSSKLVKYTNVTPLPEYEKMTDVELHRELAKYGIGKCGKKKAIIMLKKIYDQLHPTILVEDTVIESPKGRKRKMSNHIQTNINEQFLSTSNDKYENSASFDSSLSSQEGVNILEESCFQFHNSQEMNESAEEVLSTLDGKKPIEISEWRRLFVEFIRLPENKVIYNRILSYSIFELSEIYNLVKSSAHSIRRISKPNLVTILDELHISFAIPKDGWEAKARKRKK